MSPADRKARLDAKLERLRTTPAPKPPVKNRDKTTVRWDYSLRSNP